MAEKKEKPDNKLLVVSELPKQEVSEYKEEDGTKITFLTIQDALSILLKDVKAIRESVA